MTLWKNIVTAQDREAMKQDLIQEGLTEPQAASLFELQGKLDQSTLLLAVFLMKQKIPGRNDIATFKEALQVIHDLELYGLIERTKT